MELVLVFLIPFFVSFWTSDAVGTLAAGTPGPHTVNLNTIFFHLLVALML